MSLETIYILQVSKAILSDNLVEYLRNNCDYIDATASGRYDTKEFIVSVYFLTSISEEDDCDTEILEEIQKVIKEIEVEIDAQRDSEFDGLIGYDYIQFI